MITWRNFGVLFPQFNSKFGVAFYIKLVAEANAGKQEQLFTNFKHKSVLAKGQAFGYACFSEAIFAKFF